jgi:hypothetical protein
MVVTTSFSQALNFYRLHFGAVADGGAVALRPVVQCWSAGTGPLAERQ